MKKHFCPCCGMETLHAVTCCNSCYAARVKEIERRQALPPGQKQEDEPIPEVPSARLFGDLKGEVAICTDCGKKKLVCGHILGKPYCSLCLSSTDPTWSTSATADDISPSQENAVRRMEDAQ